MKGASSVKHFSLRNRSVFAMTSLAVLLPTSLWAQGARGSITGEVKDTSGAVVPNAVITVTQLGTNFSFAGQSQANGVYLIPNLVPGTYSVSAEVQGFK